ncbi:unnamed protein product [Caenorhabditis angaria]|uniref:Cyclic nucleotide-binding domain-containing protein n=1 Tax=Caenorhabditis angaria TaxID=860376 RepID=A0A9P1IGM4_9PELO|nr:unnamed protein product [Caenorhabditis angaria]
MSTTEPDPPAPNGTAPTPALDPTPAALPIPTTSSTTPTRPSLLKRIFKRRNRVHNDEGAQDQTAVQNNFMAKHGVNNGAAPGAAPTLAEAEVNMGCFQKLKHRIANFTIDPSTDMFYYWTCFITAGYIYNLLFIIARQVFKDLNGPTSVSLCSNSTVNSSITLECSYEMLTNMKAMPTLKPYEDNGWAKHWNIRLGWFICDVFVDIIYAIDCFLNSRMGFLEQGLVERDIEKIHKRYFASREFKIDIITLIPLDYLLGWPFPVFTIWKGIPLIRANRLLRVARVKEFLERTETRSSIPNAFRVLVVVCYIVIIIHWNACLYFWISEFIGLGTDNWVYGHLNKQSLPDDVTDTLLRRYVYSFYWSTLILTTIGEVPSPVRNIEFVFVTLDLMCGVLIFATIVGNVGSMISNMSAARTEFQNKMDGIKQYMELRKVSKQLEMRVIKWFDYLWANKQSLSDQQVLKVLPDKLQAEIAMQVHFETLRKVRIFQDCEAGLLAELVLKLQLQVFSPGDYICRKGDIGREMYIVKRGRLQVVAEDGIQVFATLQEGSVFGELSILNIAGSKNGNRRTANVRSVGYTDLFVLNKNDLWNALREYPEARKSLLTKGREILRKDNLLDENAPEEQQSVEEIAENLNGSVKVLQTRMARLIAEHSSTETKLLKRIEMLENHLARYKALSTRRQKHLTSGSSLDTHDIDMPSTSTHHLTTTRHHPRLRHAQTLDLTTGSEQQERLLK